MQADMLDTFLEQMYLCLLQNNFWLAQHLCSHHYGIRAVVSYLAVLVCMLAFLFVTSLGVKVLHQVLRPEMQGLAVQAHTRSPALMTFHWTYV